VIEDQIEPVTDLLAGGARLEDLAERTDMELGQIDWSADVQEGIAAYATFRDVVSALEPGAFPELHELEGGGLFTLRVDEVRAPELQPFEAVREQVESDWVLAETRRRLLEQARQITDQIGPDTEFTELGLDGAISETGLTRRSFLNGTPPGFMGQVFDLDVGGTAVVEGSASVLIVRLDAITPPSEEDALVAAEAEAVAARAGQGMALDIFSAFSGAVQAGTDVDIRQEAVNAVHANFQ
jgi:peptidyl-prolyl cis-trans isomerase D